MVGERTDADERLAVFPHDADVALAREVGTPDESEFATGSGASDATGWLNGSPVDDIENGEPHVDGAIEHAWWQ
jgi:hypothetical protein